MRLNIMTLIAAVFVSGQAFGFDVDLAGKTFSGEGTWYTASESGTWSSSIKVTPTDQGLLILDQVKIDTEQGVMDQSIEWVASVTRGGFFNVLKVDRAQTSQQQSPSQQQQSSSGPLADATLNQIGTGYCFAKVCHIEFSTNDQTFEETYHFKNDKLVRVGSMNLDNQDANERDRVRWKGVLADQKQSL